MRRGALAVRNSGYEALAENVKKFSPELMAPICGIDAQTIREVARLYATRAQVRVMARNGVIAVEGGRPKCQLCDFPMDPAGHICPRWN